MERLVSTHISWVLLCEKKAYKIKKPFKLSFLDFSSLSKREFFCQEELKLNQRLTEGVYLNVLEIRKLDGRIYLGGSSGELIDYALEMKRLDNSREMTTLLKNGLINKADIDSIAERLVRFHQSTEIVKGASSSQVLLEDFCDISQTKDAIVDIISDLAWQRLDGSLGEISEYLDLNSDLISERDDKGFIRDCHGDLHSGNIFLINGPILFDCIEFNEHFRHIDVLSELAFLSMDLEFIGREDLSTYFIERYNFRFPVIRNTRDERLFLFFKLYKANIRLKVNALKCQQKSTDTHMADIVRAYFKLYMNYFEQLRVVN
ncbi:MAG: hypothetical protein HKO93_01415 [Flavobacteriales bacterium]|nr:hypothetical protein [Flavobacteriales bacterium]